MPQELRLFNIGNTHVQCGVLSGGKITGLSVCDTVGFEAPQDGRSCAAASVVPAVGTKFVSAGAFVLDSRSLNPGLLNLSAMKSPSTIGADRLANAVSLTLGALPAVCIDFGTCITFETVDAERRMLGGAILPGRMLLRRALNSWTAQLPLTELRKTAAEPPGDCTVDAVDCGCDLGAAGSVRFILESLQRKFPGIRVVLTGGDAEFFHPFFPDAEQGGADFTLRGLAEAFRARIV